jgi:ATP-dependent helicase/nuclease subunit A
VSTLSDQPARDRIGGDLGSTLFVEAGAGSGKTHQLVGRIVALVTSDPDDGGVEMNQVAAVTFTDKAAAELRDRIRLRLEQAARTGDPRATAALDELDEAAIGTLHSFAQRILTQHPIEANLPPLVEVGDDVAAQIAFDQRWQELRSALLGDEETADLVRTALSAGVSMEHLRSLADTLDDNWDLIAERSLVTPALPGIDRNMLLRRAKEALNNLHHCTDHTDKLLAKLHAVQTWTDELETLTSLPDQLAHLLTVPSGGRIGQKGNWNCGIDDVRGDLKDLADAAKSAATHVVDAVLRNLIAILAKSTLRAAKARQDEGRLQFHDLLVLARQLLRNSPDVRAALQNRYRRLLLDEFQDTDPIQVELAARIAGGRDAVAADWRDIEVPPGSLFVVGDPKQSIYRFRRANISTFLQARKWVDDTVTLTTNFRSNADLLGWVNHTFSRLIIASESAQPDYIALSASAVRPNPADPVVLVLGEDAHPDKLTASELRAHEAADVAGVIVAAIEDGWLLDGTLADGWTKRPVTLDDITILVPARTSIHLLEEALDRAGVPYRTEATSFTYQAREVRDLLLLARAIDDPTDELATVAGLRSPLLGCGDDDLFRWKSARGSWNPFAPAPEGLGSSPVGAGLAWVGDLARQKALLTPSQLLDRIVRDRRVLEVAAMDSPSPRHRETWRRIRFVLDQARAWSESEHGSLRDYLTWAARQSDDRARVTEAVLPETDSRSVRITTIHAAKGLQFPMVIVSGMTSAIGGQLPNLLWPERGGLEIGLKLNLRSAGYDGAGGVEKTMSLCESLRLLYVACTRAESKLVVSLHRSAHSTQVTYAGQLAMACQAAVHGAFTSGGGHLSSMSAGTRAAVSDWESWSAAHALASRASEERAAVSATAVARGDHATLLPSAAVAGLKKEPRDLELPPWAKGRYGSAVGRAVHSTLQSVDLASGLDLAAIAAAAATAENVTQHANVVSALASSALAHPVVRRAASRAHWKETYVGTVIDGVLLEGYVDLLYREDDGRLVVVDYKTDAAPTADTLAVYETQLALYARAVADATGGHDVRTELVFCRAG